MRGVRAEGAWGLALRSRDGRLLIGGFASLTIAEWMTAAALAVHLFEVGGEAAVGLLAVLFIPTAIAGLGAGTLSERRPPERVLTATAVTRAALIACAAVALEAGSPLGVVVSIVALDAAVAAAYRPAQAALLPFLARSPTELGGMAGALSTTRTVSQAVGTVLGGLLIATVSTGAVFFGAAALFGLVALLTAALHIRTEVIARRSKGPAAAGDDEGRFATARQSLRAFARIASHQDSRLVIELAALRAAVRGAWLALAVLAAAGFLDMGATGFGQLAAAAGVGAVIAVPAASLLVGSPRLAGALGASLAGISLALVGVAAVGSAATALILIAGWGFGMAVADLSATAVLPRIADARQLGQMTAVTESLKQGAEGAGSLLAPLVATAIGTRSTLLATGSAAALIALVAVRSLHKVDTLAGRRVARIDVIRRTPLLRPLRVAELEAVAAAAKPKRIEAGGEVVREGDRDAAAFYVIEEGTAEVLVQGKLLRTLGPGESFGEIALLHGIQRTATVRARTALDLLEVDRSDFVWAVTGAENSRLLRPRASSPRETTLRTLEEALRQVPWLAHLDPPAVTELAAGARQESVPPGEVLWSQGEHGDTMVILLAGSVTVEQGGRVEATVGPGECVGEVAVLHGVPRTATVRASVATTFYELRREQVREVLALADGGVGPLVERLS
jgi:CRP-like cAMP-binding protein/MFS family permease